MLYSFDKESSMGISRRNILSMIGSAPLLSLPSIAAATHSRRHTKVAYFTDLHLAASNEINLRAQKAFKKAHENDLFLFGGDNLMAVDHQPEDQVLAQFDNWNRFTANHLTKPHRSILGNHDIENGSPADGTHLCGKRRTMELYNMKDRYWVDHIGGWRIIGLDTVQKIRDSYHGHVDTAQLKWLEGVLAADRHTPTMVLGHIPLLSVTPMADYNVKSQPMSMPVSYCSHVRNARTIIKMFRQAGNIKLCMSGHTHMNDRCEFGGTTYVCAGAVSGSWWNGNHQGFAPSFTQINLMTDGDFDLKTVHFE